MNDLISKLGVVRKGEESVAKNSVRMMFDNLSKDESQETYAKWKESFSYIHGSLDTQREVDVHKLEGLYNLSINTEEELFRFIFSLETYYSIILRFIGYRALTHQKLDSSNVFSVLEGSYFEKLNIFNYRCDAIYDWFWRMAETDTLLDPIVGVFNSVCFKSYERDLLKYIHENIFPSKIRHSMGEFYTPYWMVDFIVSQITEGDEEHHNRTFFDPTCGSGSFLINVIRRAKTRNPSIINNIFGVDLNPVSVLAAKTNILLAASTEIKQLACFYIIPIFHRDITRDPLDDPKDSIFRYISPMIKIRINDRELTLPRGELKYREVLNVYIAMKNMELVKSKLSNSEIELYNQLKDYSLSEIEKDRFLSLYATHALEKVDYIIGNPPWVNWEYLPKDYRSRNAQVWQDYGLFELKGMDSTFIKEDISTLITYVVVDRYLKNGGKLGFVLKETLFKSSKHGNGFRKFFLENTSVPLKVLKVYDLSQIKPFPGVNNRTSFLFLLKGEETTYPVPYYVWQTNSRATIGGHKELEEVLRGISQVTHLAKPSEEGNRVSGWITLSKELIDTAEKILGTSHYKARTGVFTGGANAVYWLNILESNLNEVKVINETKSARKKVEQCICDIEKDYVYPLLRGSELGFWKYSYTRYILCPHTKDTKMYPLPIEKLEAECPKTYQYLEQFREFLENRGGFAGWEKNILSQYFYAIQRIGSYTFERYKVAWRYISKKFLAAVIDLANDEYLGKKIIIPNEKIISVGLNDRAEAYFLCGLISSDLYRKVIESYMVETQIGPHILDKLNIPKFDKTNNDHQRISKLCERGHRNKERELFLSEINEIVSNII